MKLTEYVIVLKKNKKQIFNKKNKVINKINEFKPFLIVKNKYDLYKQDSEWFLNFLNNKDDRTIYFNCNNINFNIKQNDNETIDIDLWNQFVRDVKRCNFKLNKFKITDFEFMKNISLNFLNKDYIKFNIILFLCSQASLAFVIKSIHDSIMNSKKNYIVAELPDDNKYKRKMDIHLNVIKKNINITKYLRIIAINDEGNAITIKSIRLTLNFNIEDDNQINSVISIDILN